MIMSDTCITHIEDHWKALTEVSNDFFEKGDFESALSGYKNALYRAEVLNNHFSDCLDLEIPFIQVYMISCNNLANTYDELGQQDEAGKMLLRGVHYLLHLSGMERIDQQDIHHELKRAVLSLLSYTEKNGGQQKQEKLLAGLKALLIERQLIKINS